MTARRDIEAITERIRQRSRAGPRALSRPHRRGVEPHRQPRRAVLRQPRAWLCRLQPFGKAGARRRQGAESRHHHLLQRHAVGASAVRDLSGADQGRGARGRRHRPGGRRRAGHVRWRHAGPARHGAVAVFARRDRHGRGDRPVAQHVRRRRLSRRLRQDRAGAGDRGADLRPSAGGVHPGRADDDRPAQRREGQGPPALCRGQGRPRRTARGRVQILSRAGHLHLLRHRQFQPDADGDHGPAHARRLLRQSGHAAARRADARGDEAGAGDHRARQRLHAGRPHDRRALDRQRRRRPACHRRLDQPHHPPDRHGGGGRHHADLAGHFRPVGSGAAAGARLSERACRREPFPRRRRDRLPDPRTARRRHPARGCADGVGRRPAALCGRGEARRRRQRGARSLAARKRRREGAGAVQQGVPADRRPEGAGRQSRPRRHQDLGGEAGAPRHRGAGQGVRQPARR